MHLTALFSMIGNDPGRWVLDFAFPAVFIALLVPQVKGKAGLVAPALRRADYRGRRKPAIDWASEAARHGLLKELVADAATLVTWGQQAGQPVSLRQAAEVVQPKFDGYKAHVTAQRGGDGKPRLVTGLTVTPGNTPDGDGAVAALAEREALTGYLPEELMGGTAYGGIRQAAPPWQQHYRRRSEIEHVIRGLTRLRDRATHSYGNRKTKMQLIWQAIGYNIHELARFPILRPEPV